jgi:hypothetical protein
MSNIPNIFHPEDFSVSGNQSFTDSDIAIVAEQIFYNWLKAQPVVFGIKLGESNLTDQHGPGYASFSEESTRLNGNPTHKAYLVNVQPIEPEVCEHYPASGQDGQKVIICKYCNKKFRLKFESVE